MVILHLSDTHGCHHRLRELPKVDVVVHSGDFTMNGSEEEAIYGILDYDDGINYGDRHLLKRVMEIKTRLHLFGHIHSCHGTLSKRGIIFSNGAIMNSDYSDLLIPNIICF